MISILIHATLFGPDCRGAEPRGNSVHDLWSFALKSKAKKLKVPIYPDQSPDLAALLRVQRVIRDHHSVGFFKIGALPLVVLEDTVVELHHPSGLAAFLKQIEDSTHSDGKQRRAIELRNVELKFLAYPDWNLTAQRIVPKLGGKLQLKGVVLRTEMGARHSAAHGLLSLDEDQSGTLRLSNNDTDFKTPRRPIRNKTQNLTNRE